MRVLIVFIFLITIVGCSKEPSVLERCIATNSEEVNYYDKFVPFFKEALRLNDIVKKAVENNNEEEYQLSVQNLYLHLPKFNESLTDIEMEVLAINDAMAKSTDTEEEVFNNAKQAEAEVIESIKAKAVKTCAAQGIY